MSSRDSGTAQRLIWQMSCLTGTRGRDDGVTVVVAAGDTVWDLAETHYGYVDADVVQHVAAANDLRDPSLILVGQQLVLPPIAEHGGTTTADGDVSGVSHRVVHGDTLWDILDDHYGHVDSDLVQRVAEANGLADPSLIIVGTIVVLPDFDVEPTPPTMPSTPDPVDVDADVSDGASPGTEVSATSTTNAASVDEPASPPARSPHTSLPASAATLGPSVTESTASNGA